MPGTPISSSPWSMAGEIKARWRIATDPRRTADEYAVWLHQLLELEGYPRERGEPGHHRHGRPARAAQSRSALGEIFRREAADRRAGRGRMADRARRRRSRKASAPTARSTPSPPMPGHQGDLIVIDFGTATTFDVVDFSGAYKGGIIAPGHQPQPRCAGRRRRQAAAHRDRRAGGRQRRRPDHGNPDADRRLLGLCGDDRGAGGADEGRDRPAGDGHRHRRPRRPVRQAYRRVRRDRARPHHPGPGACWPRGPAR